MVTNKFLNHPDNTDTGFQAEFDKIIIESIQATGHDIVYLPRSLVKEDDLFGEDTISEFKENGCIEMFIESVDGFEGDKEFVSKFGIEIRDQVTFLVSQTRWQEECINGLSEPKEGDLIYMPLTNDLFEIRFVQDDPNFFQQNKNYLFRLTCEKFDYSHEEFDTGIPEIDALDDIFDNANDPSNDPFADNADIQEKSNAIRDFSEDEPFGSM